MRWAWRCVVFMPALVFLILYKVIYACVLRYVLRYTSFVSMMYAVLYYDISCKVSCRVRQFVAVYLVERWMGDSGWIQYIPRTTTWSVARHFGVSHEFYRCAACDCTMYLVNHTVVLNRVEGGVSCSCWNVLCVRNTLYPIEITCYILYDYYVIFRGLAMLYRVVGIRTVS